MKVCRCRSGRTTGSGGLRNSEVRSLYTEALQTAVKLKTGEITKEEYDRWRYYYPKYDTSGQWHKITPSQELSDMLVEALKEDQNE